MAELIQMDHNDLIDYVRELEEALNTREGQLMQLLREQNDFDIRDSKIEKKNPDKKVGDLGTCGKEVLDPFGSDDDTTDLSDY